jgi:hypothetical protein
VLANDVESEITVKHWGKQEKKNNLKHILMEKIKA